MLEGLLKDYDKNYTRSFFALALAFTIIKLIFIYFSTLPLWADEAQYWVWSKNLDFGYYSKPPMIAWVIAFFTEIFGNSEFAVRLPATLVHFLTAILIFKTANRLFDDRTAFISGLLYLFIPAVTFSSHFISTDALLMFFWALATFYCLKALRKNKLRHWLMVGVAVGLGLLSKYTIVIFYPSLGLYLLSSQTYRKYLLQYKFWLSGIVAVLVFLPNIIWNMNHQLVSLHHTEDNVFTGGLSLYPKEFLEFFIAQFVVFGVLSFALFLYAVLDSLKKIFSITEQEKFLLLLSLPLLSAGILISLISTAQAHWAAPVYIYASIYVVYFCLKQNWNKMLKLAISINIIFSIAFLFVCVTAATLNEKTNIRFLHRLYEWHSIAGALSKGFESNPDMIIIADERKSAAILLYNLRNQDGSLPKVYKWNPERIAHDYFDMQFDVSKQKGSNAILVSRNADGAGMGQYFLRVKKLEVNSLPDKFNAYYLEGFKGY